MNPAFGTADPNPRETRSKYRWRIRDLFPPRMLCNFRHQSEHHSNPKINTSRHVWFRAVFQCLLAEALLLLSYPLYFPLIFRTLHRAPSILSSRIWVIYPPPAPAVPLSSTINPAIWYTRQQEAAKRAARAATITRNQSYALAISLVCLLGWVNNLRDQLIDSYFPRRLRPPAHGIWA